MYAPSRVAARLSLAASEFGVTPEPHTPEEVDEFEKYLVKNNKYTYNNLGAPESTQNLTDFDRAWMLNEQLLVLCDASYALTRYCYIKNEQNIIERFRFRVPQQLLFNIICDLEASSRTLEIMILKARQLGMSTLIELLIGHRIIFAYGANAIIGSADQTKTGLMVNMLFLAYDLMPVWLKPKPTRRVESERGMLVFGTNSSGVSFQHGSQMSGIARGTTPTIYHLSEVASFTDAEDQIESSLFRCVHPSPSVFGILESSGEGDKGWWPDTWRSSRDNWSRDGARLCPLFLPWFCGIEMYPTRQWILHDHPIPPRWTPNRDTQLHVAKCELYVRATPLLARALSPSGQPWHMPPEQQWYWEFGHEEAKRKGTQAKWYQEMCHDGDQRVSTEKGIIKIKHADEASYTESGRIEQWHENGTRDCVELITEMGRSVVCTPDHRFHTSDGWIEAQNLHGCEIILVAPRFADTIFSNEGVTLNENLARLLGLFLGDGWCHANGIEIACAGRDPDVVAQVKWLMSSLVDRVPREATLGGLVRLTSNHKKLWRKILLALHAAEPALDNKHIKLRKVPVIPESVWRSPRCIVKAFLSGLFEADGHARRAAANSTFFSANLNLAREVQFLLLGFGINAPLRKHTKKGTEFTGYSLDLNAQNSDLFHKEIGFLSVRKRAGLRGSGKNKWSLKDIAIRDKVESVRAVGPRTVYDLTITDSHQYGVHGLLTHNCSDDEDALQRSVVSAFGHDTIIELDALRERRYDIYGLSGQSIEDAHEVLPDFIDYSRERIPVQYKNHQNITYRWELIPLQHLENLRENAAEDVEGVLVVFHPPRPNINYSIGVDTSEGKGEDSTVISVWALGYSGLPDVQVAEFSSSHVNHVEAFAFTMCISAYYKQFMELGITRWPEPYVSIEQVAAVGDTCQFQMSKMGYHNFHRMGRYDRRDVAKSKQNSNQRGWFTHGWSRPILTGNFVHAAQNNWAQVNSPWLIEEMKDWEVHKTRDGKPRLEHSERSHDDRIFAAAMAIFCPHDLEKLSERSKKRLTEAFALPPVDIAPSAPGLVINSRDLAESRTLTLQDILYGDTSNLRRHNY